MIFLYVILAVLLLVIFILLVDLSLVFEYKEEFKFKIKIFCFTLSGEKIIKLAEAREENSDKTQPPQKLTNNSKKKKTPSDILDLISYISGIIRAVLGEFVRYARLKLGDVKISIGTEDPASTALIYGVVSSGLYTALEFLDSFMTVKKNYKNIGVVPDFTSDECRIRLKVILKLKIIHLLFAALHILPTLAKGKERN